MATYLVALVNRAVPAQCPDCGGAFRSAPGFRVLSNGQLLCPECAQLAAPGESREASALNEAPMTLGEALRLSARPPSAALQ